jgi:branched-chain amino acid transport system substrate-binding protein
MTTRARQTVPHGARWLRPLGLAVMLAAGTLALAQPQVVPVGTLFDYTGALAEFGPAHQNAAVLAADQLNAAATAVFGGPIIRLIHEDSATSAASGVDRARKLVDVDGVPAIVGSLASGVTINVAESVTIPAQVLQISPASTSPLLSVLDDDDFLFRTTSSDALQGVVAAQLTIGEIIPEYSHTRAATIYENSPYGQGLSNAFTRSFEARGGTVTAQVAHPTEPQPTYASQLEAVLAGDPEVVIAIGYPGQATVYLTEARDLFGFTNFQYVDGTQSEQIIDAMGADVEGRYGTSPGSNPEWGGFQRFVADYEEAYGERPPLPFMDSAYDAVVVIGLAIAKAYVDGVEATGPTLRDYVRVVANSPGEVVGVNEFEVALRLLEQGADIAYSGAASDVDFDEVGDVVTAVEIWRYADGTVESLMTRTADEIPAE